MTPIPPAQPIGRRRARDLGIEIGAFPTGRFNAITDVRGVQVGHTTIIRGEPGSAQPGGGPVRTGVTAIMPRAGNVYDAKAVSGAFVLNGAGELTGLTQVMEWGLIETPILLTNTLSVGTCSAAAVEYMVAAYPSIGREADVIIPVVGECDDSWLNDIIGGHVHANHVHAAIEGARSGPVEEGNVGGGTGMMTCGFKGGIGTSSRRLPDERGGYTLGVLVMSNFGEREDLRVDGVAVGRILAPRFAHLETRRSSYGSIIALIATDAPLVSHQLSRLCKRVALGIGRSGSYAAHNSGEIVMAFSVANSIPRLARRSVYRLRVLHDHHIDPLYQAAVEATEEAILNALCMATDMAGVDGHFAPAIPLDDLQLIHAGHKRLEEQWNRP
ncbi:MAG TPA: P1 family peptidase [Kofleriaceae bacterium]|nr:P1 family peptidase [Kofleriaceae bacterium]